MSRCEACEACEACDGVRRVAGVRGATGCGVCGVRREVRCGQFEGCNSRLVNSLSPTKPLGDSATCRYSVTTVT